MKSFFNSMQARAALLSLLMLLTMLALWHASTAPRTVASAPAAAVQLTPEQIEYCLLYTSDAADD